MVVPTCKVYDMGFFTKKTNDPDKFFDNMRALRKELKNSSIDNRKKEIHKLKRQTYIRIDQELNLRNIPMNEAGNYIIAPRYKVLKHMDTNEFIISSRNSKFRTYRNESGQLMTETGEFVIKRRKELLVRNGNYVIGKRKKKVKYKDGLYYIGCRKRNVKYQDGLYYIKPRKVE